MEIQRQTKDRNSCCQRRNCPKKENYNPNLVGEYCRSPESDRCIHLREIGERGMFGDPSGGQHYFS